MRTGLGSPLARRMTKKEALPVSVTRTPNEGKAASHKTTRLPSGAGFKARIMRSVRSCFITPLPRARKSLGATLGQRIHRVNAHYPLFHSVMRIGVKRLSKLGFFAPALWPDVIGCFS